MLIAEDDIILKSLLLIVFVLTLSLISYEITRHRLVLSRRLKISGITAVLLTLFTLFCLQGHSILFNQEGVLSGKIARLSDWYQSKRGVDLQGDYDTFTSPMIFINTTDNPILIPLPGSNHLDDAHLELTDRAKLDSVLSFLSKRTDLGLVACDILFSEASSSDAHLASSMLPLQHQAKLVVAWYRQAMSDNPGFYGRFDDNVFGDVTAQTDEPVYYSHQIHYLPDTILSFPYQMHARLHDTTLSEEKKGRYFADQFVTVFRYTDEALLYSRSSRMATRKRRFHNNNKIVVVKERHLYSLGSISTADGQEELDKVIKKIVNRGQKPIIMIGNFTADEQDMHPTAHGKLHGATIILNEFAYIESGLNTMAYGYFTAYCGFLLAGYFGVTLLILFKADRHDLRRHVNTTSVSPPTTRVGSFLSWMESVLFFIIDESFYLLLLVFALLIYILFHTIINIIGLIYVIPLFSILLKYYINLHNRLAT